MVNENITRLQLLSRLCPSPSSIVTILKLSEIERDLCHKGLFEYISVQVAVSLTWFIRRFAANYLAFDEQSYKHGND